MFAVYIHDETVKEIIRLIVNFVRQENYLMIINLVILSLYLK